MPGRVIQKRDEDWSTMNRVPVLGRNVPRPEHSAYANTQARYHCWTSVKVSKGPTDVRLQLTVPPPPPSATR